MMIEATQFRMLRDIYRRDPALGPDSTAIMRDVFKVGGEDCGAARPRRKNRADY
jgi:hypothetical protein